ncbi:hypothetical protein RSOL_208240 [Rhizoctonia solani AG-3 Rhs1AP]|uniref:Uncharacterized protein n=2 Tax=Rhizoctonia solani AG-3 TaxID=1086053 RepID=A0A074RW53_9AGAM|nr:hypothetical protein RSOL_208240 [Rhizoctonia solani AG-3 Rhs1AP]KEP51159.1 hypothetical protein V565_066490 [Rhizoctonia solani 123E]
MEESTPESTSYRGRGKRGGHGKSVRARGRGKRFTTPAPFRSKEEEEEDEVDEEEVERERAKYARRGMKSNADRYEEKEPDPEEEPEPEVDLSEFMRKQQLDDEAGASESIAVPKSEVDDDIDHSLDNFGSRAPPVSQKGQKGIIEWDESLEAMKQEKEKAEAVWELKARFKHAPQSKPRANERRVVRQPRLAGEAESTNPKKDMEEFLDDLLT